MDEDQQNLIRASFGSAAPHALEVARMFYGRLFELEPKLRPLFKGDMDEQGRKLMAMLATVVGNLHKLEAIVPAVRALGARHAGYGVRDEDYGTVAAALLWTFEKALGDAFTPATRDAWVAAYTVLAGQMQDAAHGVAAAAEG
jgi:hemoglobin-like flavoprotein